MGPSRKDHFGLPRFFSRSLLKASIRCQKSRMARSWAGKSICVSTLSNGIEKTSRCAWKTLFYQWTKLGGREALEQGRWHQREKNEITRSARRTSQRRGHDLAKPPGPHRRRPVAGGSCAGGLEPNRRLRTYRSRASRRADSCGWPEEICLWRT